MISEPHYPDHLRPDTKLYALDIEPHVHGDHVVCESGVIKGDRDQAITGANAALEHIPPGTCAVLRQVVLHPSGRAEYETLAIRRARHDEHGRIAWSKAR